MRKTQMLYIGCIKRPIGFVGAFIALVLTSPIWIFTIIWLYFANEGAGVFFLQERPGLNGKIFRVFKFKSMSDKRDSEGQLLPDCDRLTRAGRFVRSTSIDELPQLINVLKGDMAFIGPRPLLVRYLPYYTEREKLRHTVRPGITGWAQIHGRNLISWDDKLEYDAYYAEHVSLWMDIKIFFMTIVKVLKREGAVADKKENYFDIERQNAKK